MNTELIEALELLEKERGIDKAVLIETLEAALVSAYKKNFEGDAEAVRATVDPETGEMKVFATKEVVDEVYDETMEITLEDARKINSAYEKGDMLEVEVTPDTFGRLAAQTAKQVIVQRLKEAERSVIYDEFMERTNEVISAVVHRIDRGNAYVELGKAEAILPASEMLPGEVLNSGDRVKVYVCDVKKMAKGLQIVVSRTHPGLVKKLFEMEVPEIAQNIVTIKSISREAGFRSKVAVATNDENVDPVGACVGPMGSRIERVVAELGNEKIDIIPWSANPIEFIANALRPAKVIMVQINEEERAAKVVVPDNQLSLAIGREGQNARLAVKLTGWKIDIKSETQAREMGLFEQMGLQYGDAPEDTYEEEIQDDYQDYDSEAGQEDADQQ